MVRSDDDGPAGEPTHGHVTSISVLRTHRRLGLAVRDADREGRLHRLLTLLLLSLSLSLPVQNKLMKQSRASIPRLSTVDIRRASELIAWFFP